MIYWPSSKLMAIYRLLLLCQCIVINMTDFSFLSFLYISSVPGCATSTVDWPSIRTVRMSALGKLLTERVERMWALPRAQIGPMLLEMSWTEDSLQWPVYFYLLVDLFIVLPSHTEIPTPTTIQCSIEIRRLCQFRPEALSGTVVRQCLIRSVAMGAAILWRHRRIVSCGLMRTAHARFVSDNNTLFDGDVKIYLSCDCA